MNIGFNTHGTISKKKRVFWELQLLALIRSFSDGITFFNLKINFNRWVSEHTPSFEIELTILNCYNNFLIYQNNFDTEETELLEETNKNINSI